MSIAQLGMYIPHIDRAPAGMGRYLQEICPRVLAKQSGDTPVFRQVGCAPWGRSVEIDVPGGRLPPVARRATRIAWLASRQLKRSVDDLDVLFCPSQEGPLRAMAPAVCLVVHDVTPLRVASTSRRADAMQLNYLLPRMARTSDKVITVSANTRRDLVALFDLDPADIEVVPEGVDHAVFFPRSRDETASELERLGLPSSYLFYAGTLAQHKNIETLLRALAAVRQAGAEVDLVMVGRHDESDLASVVAASAQLGATEYVHILGYQPLETVARLMSGAAAFVYPSLYEGFGLAVLEAMACGAAVIASDRASLPEVVGPGGKLLPPHDVAGWTSSILALLADPSATENAKGAALRQAGRFSWDESAAKTYSVLRDLAVRRRG